MDKPLDNNALPSEVGQRIIDKPELPQQGISSDTEVMTETIAGEMHLKRGRAGKFEVLSDEPARIGGTDTQPSPMTYLAMSIGF